VFVHRRDVQLQWGDCDPANIVYYPRYFEMFDDPTRLKSAAVPEEIVAKFMKG
jgi:4-hydroxybenzoyl-CoA thioesterase